MFDHEMWVMGGGNNLGLFNDAWHSPDGVHWTQAPPSAPYTPVRQNSQSLVFNNQMWVLGGLGIINFTATLLNDAWSSSDGSTWVKAPPIAPYPVRSAHAAVVFNGRMWVLGGSTQTTALNDVWSSTDGSIWTQAPLGPGFPPRFYHSAVVYHGRMWIFGGDNNGTLYNDAWSSSDGTTWNQSSPTAPYPARFVSAALVYPPEPDPRAKMWILGGAGGSLGNLNDAWYSSDGSTWTLAPQVAPLPKRAGHTALTFLNQMWVLGGGTGPTFFNDVWHSP